MMGKKVKPSEPLGKQFDELTGQGMDAQIHKSGAVLSHLIRLSFRKIVQDALEQEVADWLGRGWYQRGDRERTGLGEPCWQRQRCG